MIADYHTHTELCGHASGNLDAYAGAATARGIDEIALTDHLFLYYLESDQRDPSLAMREELYPDHHEAMRQTMRRWGDRITVRVSVEADWVSGAEQRLKEILADYEFDFVLGGIHYVDGWLVDAPEDLDHYERIPIEEIYHSYFREVRAAAESGLFHALAHFDLPKKFGYRPPEEIRPVILETLDCVKESGCALEVSSVGFRDPVGECYPSPWIIGEMKRREIPIVLSSDAHAPAEVAYGFDRLVPMLLEIGYRSITTFEGGGARSRPLG